MTASEIASYVTIDRLRNTVLADAMGSVLKCNFAKG